MTAALPALHLAKCHHPVRGLGHGARVGIWFQGCSIRCRGCIVPETWDATPAHAVALPDLLRALLPWLSDSDGVTISGGEPFDQPDALFALVTALRRLCDGDLLVYSGYPWRRLQERHGDILSRVDVVVSEPFRADRRVPQAVLAGSFNQRVNLLTPLAQARYAQWADAPREISVALNAGALDLAGIMSAGELAGLRDGLAAKGWGVELTHDPV